MAESLSHYQYKSQHFNQLVAVNSFVCHAASLHPFKFLPPPPKTLLAVLPYLNLKILRIPLHFSQARLGLPEA